MRKYHSCRSIAFCNVAEVNWLYILSINEVTFDSIPIIWICVSAVIFYQMSVSLYFFVSPPYSFHLHDLIQSQLLFDHCVLLQVRVELWSWVLLLSWLWTDQCQTSVTMSMWCRRVPPVGSRWPTMPHRNWWIQQWHLLLVGAE